MKADLIKAQEQELMDLVMNASSLSDSELAEQRDLLKREHKVSNVMGGIAQYLWLLL